DRQLVRFAQPSVLAIVDKAGHGLAGMVDNDEVVAFPLESAPQVRVPDESREVTVDWAFRRIEQCQSDVANLAAGCISIAAEEHVECQDLALRSVKTVEIRVVGVENHPVYRSLGRNELSLFGPVVRLP